MGLTIHYNLRHRDRDERMARSVVEQLRTHAADLPFASVGPLLDLRDNDCDFEQIEDNDPNRWLLIQARHLLLPSHLEVKPTSVIAFSAWPGPGSEPMNIGLCLYPSDVLDQSGELRATRLSGWRWSSFCKTQYASDPSLGDVANFVRCHVSIVQLLDHAKSLGVIEEVNDEGGYYEQRNIEALIREVTKWNEAIAGFAGSLEDRIGNDLQAAITRFSNFEHLEARGRRDEDAG